MITKIQKAQKKPKKSKETPQNTKNLNSGSYDKFEENIPSPTFRVDKKIILEIQKLKKINTKNINGGYFLKN